MTTLQRANSDLKVAKQYLDSKEDELFRDQCAYHLQQAVEKIIKHMLEMRGEPYSKTHNIVLLQDQLNNNEVNKILGPFGSVFTSWEVTTRYAGEAISRNVNMSDFVAKIGRASCRERV